MKVEPEKMAEAARNAAGLLKMLANEHRLMILCQLADGSKSVGELADLIGLGQSPLSQHLARLRQEGLVTTRRAGQSIFYSLSSEAAAQIIHVLYNIFCAPGAEDGTGDGTGAGTGGPGADATPEDASGGSQVGA